MGISAIAYSATGQTVILGTAAVPTRRVQLVEVRTVVKVFLEKLRLHPGCQLSTLVPIVEWCVHSPQPSAHVRQRTDPATATTTRCLAMK
jgi:hypothetical protein